MCSRLRSKLSGSGGATRSLWSHRGSARPVLSDFTPEVARARPHFSGPPPLSVRFCCVGALGTWTGLGAVPGVRPQGGSLRPRPTLRSAVREKKSPRPESRIDNFRDTTDMNQVCAGHEAKCEQAATARGRSSARNISPVRRSENRLAFVACDSRLPITRHDGNGSVTVRTPVCIERPPGLFVVFGVRTVHSVNLHRRLRP